MSEDRSFCRHTLSQFTAILRCHPFHLKTAISYNFTYKQIFMVEGLWFNPRLEVALEGVPWSLVASKFLIHKFCHISTCVLRE